MFSNTLVVSLTLSAVAFAQQIGTLQTETHPKITVQQCSSGGRYFISLNFELVHSANGRLFVAVLHSPARLYSTPIGVGLI